MTDCTIPAKLVDELTEMQTDLFRARAILRGLMWLTEDRGTPEGETVECMAEAAHDRLDAILRRLDPIVSFAEPAAEKAA